MSKSLFTTAAILKLETIVDENVDDRLITPSIEYAMDFKLHPILGTDLYNKLQDDVIADTVTGDYLTLMDDYIFPAIKYRVMDDLTFETTNRFRNKGVQTLSSDKAQPISRSDQQYVSERFERKAEEMEQRLIDYLCENESLFPEYSTNEGKDELKPINKAAAIPFPLGGSKKQSWRNRRG